MKIVNVTYITSPAFAEQNKANIKAVMDALQKMNPEGIRYFATVAADGKTFTHVAFFRNDEDQKVLGALPEFAHFQAALRGSSPESPPKQELPEWVGSSYSIFA
jgi:hypothetical protein